MELIERVKAECDERKSCEGCKLDGCGDLSCMVALDPCHWNIEAIRKALGEKENVRGHWILEREYDGKPNCYHCSVCDMDGSFVGIKVASHYCPNCGAEMDNEHIREVIDGEIAVPEKWKHPSNLIGTEFVTRKQNEIIECLEKIVKREK